MQRSFAIIAVCAAAASTAMAVYGFNRFSGETGSPVGASGVTALEAAVERAPDNAEAWKALGRAHRAAGRPQAAVTAYIRAARLAPRDREVIAALRDLAGAAR